MIIEYLTTIQNSCLFLGTFIELSEYSLQMKNIKRTQFYRILIMVNYILNNVLLVDFSLLRVEKKLQQTLRKQGQSSETLGSEAEDSFSCLS